MDRMFFYAHSGLRYLVLLAGVLALAYFAFGLATKRPFDKGGRILGASFAGLLHLQVLLGILVLVTRIYYPALIGHIVMMVLAAGTAQACMSINRRRPRPAFVLPLVGVLLSLVFIVGGIMAIGRNVFTTTAM
jgi:vacuolar-type H+-ATPase subunit I/STV1